MNCEYERFNPVTGDCKCTCPPHKQCPHENECDDEDVQYEYEKENKLKYDDMS